MILLFKGKYSFQLVVSAHQYATISLSVGFNALILNDWQWEYFTCYSTVKENKKICVIELSTSALVNSSGGGEVVV